MIFLINISCKQTRYAVTVTLRRVYQNRLTLTCNCTLNRLNSILTHCFNIDIVVRIPFKCINNYLVACHFLGFKHTCTTSITIYTHKQLFSFLSRRMYYFSLVYEIIMTNMLTERKYFTSLT